MSESDERNTPLLRFAAALTDRDLIMVLAVLAEASGLTVEDLCAATELPANVVGRQLQALGSAGLLVTVREGNNRRYSLNLEPLAGLGARLDAGASKTGREPPDGLRQFFRGEQIVQLPAARKRQIQLLQWIVGDFEFDTPYAESEVNAILGRRHADFATLRRDLIDEQLMERERGIYRRTAPAALDTFGQRDAAGEDLDGLAID